MDLLEDIGSVPEELEKRLQEQKDVDILRKWLKLAAHSESIDEFLANIQS